MGDVQDCEKVERVLGRWEPADLAFVDRLTYETAEPGHSVLDLVARFQRRDEASEGWPDESGPSVRVTLQFRGVRDLCLTDLGSGPIQVMGFDVRSLGDRGWEDVRFDVGDYEEDRLSFRCREIQVLAVQPSARSLRPE